MKRNIFKKAHQLTKEIIKKGDDYRATFRLCLSFVYSQIKKGVEKMIEYTTDKGNRVSVKVGEGRTVTDLIVNGIKVIENNIHSNNCFLGDGYVFVADKQAYKKLGVNRMAQIIMNDELKAIYDKEMEIEMAKFNKELERKLKIARIESEVKKDQYSFKRHLSDVNYLK